MITIELENKISILIEQKFIEYFGDFDAGNKLNNKFVAEMKKRMQNKKRVLVDHSDIVNKLYAKS